MENLGEESRNAGVNPCPRTRRLHQSRLLFGKNSLPRRDCLKSVHITTAFPAGSRATCGVNTDLADPIPDSVTGRPKL
jgi:hypothetical protein